MLKNLTWKSYLVAGLPPDHLVYLMILSPLAGRGNLAPFHQSSSLQLSSHLELQGWAAASWNQQRERQKNLSSALKVKRSWTFHIFSSCPSHVRLCLKMGYHATGLLGSTHRSRWASRVSRAGPCRALCCMAIGPASRKNFTLWWPKSAIIFVAIHQLEVLYIILPYICNYIYKYINKWISK